MTLEEQARYEVLLEDLQKDVRLIAEGHVALTERLDRTEAKFEQRFEQVEQQIMVLDVKLTQKIDALDGKLTQRVDALDGKIDALDDKLSTELSRIATHLGLNGAPPRPWKRPRKPPQTHPPKRPRR